MGLVTHVANTKPLQANKFHETSWSPAGRVRVVCGIWLVAASLWPSSVFRSVDFPALGSPTMATVANFFIGLSALGSRLLPGQGWLDALAWPQGANAPPCESPEPKAQIPYPRWIPRLDSRMKRSR